MASVIPDIEFSYEQENRRKGNIAAIIFFVLCLLALFIPLTYPDPPPGQEGILVNLGIPDTGGQPSSSAVAVSEDDNIDEPEEEKPTPEKIEKPTPEKVEEKPEEIKKPLPPVKKVVTSNTNTPSLSEAEKARKEAVEKARKEAVEKARKEAAAKAAKEKAAREAEAKRKALEAEKKRVASEVADFFNDSDGSGTGVASGNEGDPNGGDSPITKGKSFGAGVVGGGLEDRGGTGPTINKKFNKRGTVVIKLCVDGSGKVIDAKFSQIGSSTTDRDLINLALSNARSWSFNSKSGIREQCGKITYQFTLK